MESATNVVFAIGACLLFVDAWIVPWLTSPVWIAHPASEFEGSVWEVFGPIFMAMSLAAPISFLLIFISTLVMSDEIRHFRLMTLLIVTIVLSSMFPATMGYYPIVFGVFGGLVLLFTFGTLWYWAKAHKQIQDDDEAKFGHALFLLSYLFFLLLGMQACALLGNPFSGLFHYGRTEVNPGSWPFLYAMGVRIVLYLTGGFICSFLGHYLMYRAYTNKTKQIKTV